MNTKETSIEQLKVVYSKLSEVDKKIISYYESGKVLSGFGGGHDNLVKLHVLDYDLDLTNVGKAIIKYLPILTSDKSIMELRDKSQEWWVGLSSPERSIYFDRNSMNMYISNPPDPNSTDILLMYLKEETRDADGNINSIKYDTDSLIETFPRTPTKKVFSTFDEDLFISYVNKFTKEDQLLMLDVLLKSLK